MKVNIPQEGKPSVVIEHFDIWNMDYTLALIILPMLKKLKKRKNSAPLVNNEDVPENLWRLDNENDPVDDRWFDRWDYIINEMIFAFESQFNGYIKQFESGKADIIEVPLDDDGEYFEFKRSEKDTYKLDIDGLREYESRIANGYRLFGKYYKNLWT